MDVPEKVVEELDRQDREEADDGAPSPTSNLTRRVGQAVGRELAPEPYESPGRSARRHWRLIAAVTVIACLGGLAAGLIRAPKYTAEAQLVVGKTVQLDQTSAIPGLAAAGAQLAADFSRLVSTALVTNAVAKSVGSGGVAGTSLSASPVPGSPIILVEATASSAARARALANAGSAGLVQAVDRINANQLAASDSLLAVYRKADEVLQRDIETLDRLQQQVDSAGSAASASLTEQLLAAKTAVNADTVKRDALAADFAGSYTPQELNSQVIQPVGPAHSTGSDRIRFLEIALLLSIVGGLLVGVGLAVLVDRRPHARA